jgi:hypothetical protein
MSAEPTRKPAASPDYPWVSLSDDELLKLRFCDLGLRIEDTYLDHRIRQVIAELRARSLRFKPHFWLSTEWFTPDGIPGIAIPFFLAHPRLIELERRLMLDAEGSTRESCMKILRHEVGHAIDNAYRLHRRRDWREVFGPASQKYPEFYQPRPHSRKFVLHIEYWYAQSHPSEDFAETFAVWLTPDSDWRVRYKSWPALKKLEYVDRLMTELAGQPPLVRSHRQAEPIYRLKTTLAEHYADKRQRYGTDYPDFYDRDLRKLFSDAPEYAGNESAAVFLRRIRRPIRRLAARWTGAYQYTIDQVLKEMIQRCRELNLRLNCPPHQAETEAAVLLAVQTMNYIHDGRHRVML